MKLCTSHFALCAVSWFAIAVSWFVVLPVAVFRFYQLWVRRSTQILWVRRLHFDVVTIIGTLSLITVTSPLVLINACSDLLQGFKIWGLLNCIAAVVIGSSLAFKTILAHCDLTFAYINQQMSWQSLIVSGEQSSLTTSRYQRWRGTWLNPTRIGLAVFACGIVAIATIIWSLATETHSFSLITLYWCFVNTVIALYTWFKTPGIIDTFGIREEIKLIGFCCLVTGVTFVAVFITMSFFNATEKPLDIVLANLVTWLCAAYLLYLSTEFRWNLLDAKTREWDKQTAARQTRDLSKQTHDQIKRIRSHSPSLGDDILDQPTVSDLINERLFRHSECVSLFAQFLIFEFSIENLIGCIEFFQFGKSLQQLHVSEFTSPIALRVVIRMNVDECCVPLSSINRVEESGAFARDWMAKFRQLCGKYIADDSMYRLNLHFRSYRSCFALRQRFDEVSANRALFTAETEAELLQETIDVVFSIVSQSIHLLKDSFYRFRADADFKRFLDVDIGTVHEHEFFLD